jgi:peptide-methionine (R)-S-oxide reductase
MSSKKSYPAQKPEKEWKSQLSDFEFEVLRNKGTERPFSGEFNDHEATGTYTCKGCGKELFTDEMKFNSHCGWPSFDKELSSAKIDKIVDHSHGMIRTEVVCGNCGSHLGHLFNDGPTETGERYCINSISLGFKRSD